MVCPVALLAFENPRPLAAPTLPHDPGEKGADALRLLFLLPVSALPSATPAVPQGLAFAGVFSFPELSRTLLARDHELPADHGDEKPLSLLSDAQE